MNYYSYKILAFDSQINYFFVVYSKYYIENFSCHWNIFHIQTRNDFHFFSTSPVLHIVQIISLVCKPKCLPLSMARMCALILIFHKIDLSVLFLSSARHATFDALQWTPKISLMNFMWNFSTIELSPGSR